MLIRFEVENFRSIGEPAELSMVAIDDRAEARAFPKFSAATAIAALVAAQTGALAALVVSSSDNAAFPYGKWPTSNTESFSDATRLDGDAYWSVKL